MCIRVLIKSEKRSIQKIGEERVRVRTLTAVAREPVSKKTVAKGQNESALLCRSPGYANEGLCIIYSIQTLLFLPH